ncbi:hypothetical protein FSP39_005221 [Pinctada imbricata]|uniref:Tripartite motif-containing protein 2 n=1 Tax=Pinctada imbricata TaxID=66713 RepID=A0AA89BYR5_PINIB|nr:hypothetical protein FSP39_005221 [Pinctada imbricata]
MQDGDLVESLSIDLKVTDVSRLPCGDLLVSYEEGQEISRIDTSGSVKCTLSTSPLFPQGIFPTSDEDMWICLAEKIHAYKFPKCKVQVVKMSSAGDKKKILEFNKRKSKLFSYPHCVIENVNEDICVLDLLPKEKVILLVFDKTLDLRFKYDGSQRSSSTRPSDFGQVANDTAGRLLLTDYGCHRIHILSKDGEFLQYILAESDGIFYPFALGITKQNVLWIDCKCTKDKDAVSNIVRVKYSREHKGHDFSGLEEVGASIGDKISKTLENIDSIILPHLESELEKVNDCKLQRTEFIERIRATIDDEYSTKKAQLDKEKKELFTHLEKQLKGDLKPLRRTGKTIQSALDQVKKFKDESQKAVLSAKTALLLDLNIAVDDIEVKGIIKAETKTFDSLDYIKGQTHENLLGRIVNDDEVGHNIVGEPIREIQYETSILSSYQTQFQKVESLCTVSPNSVWASYSKNNTLIKLQEKNGELLRKKKKRIREFYPVDIGKISDGLSISCLGQPYIYHLQRNDNEGNGEFRSIGYLPFGIHINSSEELFVCLLDEYNFCTHPESVRRVTKYSRLGTILMEIEFDDRGNRYFTLPHSVTENTNSDICVIDVMSRHNGRLVVFTTEGVKRFEYAGPETSDLSVCTHDNDGNIIISDEHNDKIHLVSMDGNFLGYISTVESCIYCPFAVAFDAPGKLWIGCKASQTEEIAQVVHLHYQERI